LIGPSVAVALAKARQSSMKAITAKLVGFNNWQCGSTGRNYLASIIFCPGLFEVDASQTFDHINSNSDSSLGIFNTSGQSARKFSFGLSLVWPNLELSPLAFDAIYFLGAESEASYYKIG